MTNYVRWTFTNKRIRSKAHIAKLKHHMAVSIIIFKQLVSIYVSLERDKERFHALQAFRKHHLRLKYYSIRALTECKKRHPLMLTAKREDTPQHWFIPIAW